MFLKKLLPVIFTCIVCTTMAQKNNDYSSNWKKVEELEKKGLTKSAQTEVINIYTLALKDNNDAQQIKSCMYQIKYRNMVEEDSHENNIFFIDTLIEKAKAPAKNILQSMQAEIFWQYLQNNRWKFYDRTALKVEKSKDISTWSIEKMHEVISRLYKASLGNESLLKTTGLNNFEPVIIKGENTRTLRPTLFDFLAHRALSYFITDENDITKPVYQFILNDSKAFSPVNEFISASFKTKDSASLHHTALILLQSILKFHSADTKPDALIDADLIRLKFVYDNAVIENKEKLYENALKELETRYGANPLSAQAAYLRANIYYDRGKQFEPYSKTEHQYEIKRAKELCEVTINKFPKSEGAINCDNLIKGIEIPELNITSEKVNTINEPFRTLVTYKNVPAIYLRIVPVTREQLKKIDKISDNEQLWKTYTALKPLQSWSVTLPDPVDYQEHSTEIKVNGLASGTYLIMGSIDENFSLTKNIIAKQVIYVSNISYIKNNNNEYYVLHRDNGQPLINTSVQVWETQYNYQTSGQTETKAEKYTADKNGMFKMRDSKNYRNFLLQFKYNSDELFLDDNEGYNTYNAYQGSTKPQTFLFTDRSIYRPGQTVFFKGIVIQQNSTSKKSEIVPDFKTKIFLRDANYKNAANITVTTNEFGSFKGSFKLPEGLMNGIFRLVDSTTNSSQDLVVEEYKRPKFFADIQKPKGTYRVNDSITVTGTAKAYAGNNIDGAKVKYRVVRKIQYPAWWEWSYFNRGKMMLDFNDETEITNGETTTDAKGVFKIPFKALPDESVDKINQPVFYYEVSADITDINGETRSGNTTVAVAYQMLQLNIDMPDVLNADWLKKLHITSTNLNDIFEKANVAVSITKVIAPDKIFRERYWSLPDQFVMSKDEYTGNFPYDIYKDEDQKSMWPLGDKLFDKTDSTKENGEWSLVNSEFKPGLYKIIATTKDKYGEAVKAEKFIRLIDTNQTASGNDQAVSIEVKKDTVEPGDKAEFKISTGFDNAWMIQTMSAMDQKDGSSYHSFEKNIPQSFEYDVTEARRGGMSVNVVFVKHNRIYKADEYISIPWSNKDLNITYATFRDKLLPGANEKWTVKISGNKGEKVAAEMLAGMYDASLDQFKLHNWSKLNIWPTLYSNLNWRGNGFEDVQSEEYNNSNEDEYMGITEKTYDRLGIYSSTNITPTYWWSNDYFGGNAQYILSRSPSVSYSVSANNNAVGAVAFKMTSSGAFENTKMKAIADVDDKSLLKFVPPKIAKDEDAKPDANSSGANNNTASVQIRKNFNETAFFFPDLKTDADGNISFEFTMPEALTQWKLMTLAHTKDLASGYNEKTVVTQKPLMVQPNAPRFLREGDAMEFSTKIVNLSDSEVTGTAQLELLDAANNKSVDGWFKNVFPNQYFTIAAGQSAVVKFPMEIPFNFNSAMSYRITAITKNASDGEEMAIPVLTNRMLVTESLPLNLRNQNSKNFKFDKLLNSDKSNTITNHAITVEYTSNPAWYAVQALPYLMEYPYECAEQTFNRYYANVLATYISNSAPKIKSVFEKWKTVDTAALLSNLQKNEELKSALLQETPWVLDAENEQQQKKNIALLFDMVKMSGETTKALGKLKDMQSPNGGFVWFKGGPDDRYITQYIITGIGHLRKLNALSGDSYQQVKAIADKAVIYLDKKIKEDYDNLLRNKIKLTGDNLSDLQIQYLYMRSFFAEYKIPDASLTAYNYYRDQSKKFWLSNSKYMQAMIALSLYRTKDAVTPNAIIKSLKENAINKDEMGMYWKEWTTGGYYWQQAPIESQAMMIEAFSDIDKNNVTVDDLKTWLLKQKQTQNWKTTKATAEACYALLLGGNNWLNEEKEVTIQLGITNIKSTDDATEAGTGYFKKRIEGAKVNAAMGNIAVTLHSSTSKPSNQATTSWGAVYWQYFEDLDKITPSETPLKLKKQLFIERNSDKGPVLEALEDGAQLKVGDKVKVRIELKVDRDMEYVHMKDMRAACMEPVNVLSEYKYQGGLGYYESTRDASTNFFFGWLNRGTYVFEYPMFVTHAGNFSNGIATIQCMYAPEFTSHSEGIRVIVE
jgi:uncharacterized protein YfaS (alpha-2-macroglobulin family)